MLEISINEYPSSMRLEPGYLVFLDSLKTELYPVSLSKLLDYQITRNFSYKVEAHITLTKIIFLTSNYPVFVDFESNKVFIELLDSNDRTIECFIRFDDQLKLYKILNFICRFIKDQDTFEFDYELYRNHTRYIFDYMDLYDHMSHKELWFTVIDQAKTYFESCINK